MIVEKNKCCGCHACFNVCPKKAIKMERDENGFKYPTIDKNKCVGCKLCEKVCPVLKSTDINNNISAYACYNMNESERLNSSSGGIFILIAKAIINKNGVVYGASLDENFEVKHIKVDTEENLTKLMGSKYVQSDIGTIFSEIKQMLEDGKIVLFTGTPCQIEGLKSFLVKDYSNLYTQDIICHGVPSPLVWKKYREYRKNKDKLLPKSISFRNKDNGWLSFNMKFVYNNKEYKASQNTDLYMQAFLKNISLRDSCYNCHFKKINRVSDITLADYWGIQNIDKNMFDNKGTSLVIINSNKGKELFELIKNDINFISTDLNEALKYNTAMTESVKSSKNREEFFRNINNYDFKKLIKKYIPKDNMFKKVIRKLKRIIKK